MSNMKTELAYYKSILTGLHKETVHKFLCGDEVQIHIGSAWVDTDNPIWMAACKYRVKPIFVPDAYYKVTLKHSGMTQVMRYSDTGSCFRDPWSIGWDVKEFSAEPKFIC